MVMPFAASSYAAFFPENFYFCRLTFCGFTFEALTGALQGGRSGGEATRRFGEQLAGPYRLRKVVFQAGGRWRTGLNRWRPPFRTARRQEEGGARERPLPAEKNPAGRMSSSRLLMAHDLKASLVLIGGFIQRLSRAEQADPGHQRRYLEIIKREGERLSALLDEFLASPGLNGEVQKPIRPVSLARELFELCEAHQLRADHHQVAFDLQCPAGLEPLPADGKGLQRAFANLLDNALKHAPPGSAIRVRVQEKGHEVRVSFADEGPGIEPADLPRLFEAFYRGRGEDATAGSGLGLATVKAVAAAHGGRVEVKNRPCRGAIFTMVLPRCGPEGAWLEVEPAIRHNKKERGNNGNDLISQIHLHGLRP